MGDRARFLSVAIILLLALVVGAAVTIRGMQSELLARTQLALAAAGIPFYDISIDGRDARLRGFASSAEQEQRIVDVVAAVPGVRRVRSDLVVERIVEPEATVAVGLPPTLRIQISRAGARVSGRLASTREATELMAALRAALPRHDIVGGVTADVAVAPAPWLQQPAALAAVVAAAGGDVRLLIQGSTAILSGSVADARARERTIEAAHAVAGLDWSFELFARDGSISGGGGAP